jgi:hypothetical protein
LVGGIPPECYLSGFAINARSAVNQLFMADYQIKEDAFKLRHAEPNGSSFDRG